MWALGPAGIVRTIVEEDSAFPGNATIHTESSGAVDGRDRLPLPGPPSASKVNSAGISTELKDTSFSGEDFSGHLTTWSFMANAAYDFPLSSKWDFTLGAGAGIGNADVKVTGNGGDSSSGSNQGFMYQGFAGFDYWLCRDISVNLDWRYRST